MTAPRPADVPAAAPVPLVFVHGAATTPRVWRHLTPLFPDRRVLCPARRSSGRLETEVADLAGPCAGAFVVGVSGGATLGLELAARGVPIRGAVLHEPAAGSLAPGLLAHVAAGLQAGGVAGFGRALYGPAWLMTEAPEDPAAVSRDFAMFREFEPARLDQAAGPVLLTTGALSPPGRVASVQALALFLDLPWQRVPGGAHAVHLECAAEFATVIRTQLAAVGG